MKQLIFNADIVNDNNFKSFKYKAKLLGTTVANESMFVLTILEKITKI